MEYDKFEKALIKAAIQSYKAAQNSARSNNSLGQSDVSGAYALNGASTGSDTTSTTGGNALTSLLGSASAIASLAG